MSDRDPVGAERDTVRPWRRRARVGDGVLDSAQVRNIGDEVRRDGDLKIVEEGLGGDALLLLRALRPDLRPEGGGQTGHLVWVGGQRGLQARPQGVEVGASGGKQDLEFFDRVGGSRAPRADRVGPRKEFRGELALREDTISLALQGFKIKRGERRVGAEEGRSFEVGKRRVGGGWR